MSELKPCPFCGKPPEQFSNMDAYRCKQCGKHSGWMSEKDWNARSDNKLVKALEEHCVFLAKAVLGVIPTDEENKKAKERLARISKLKEGKP